MSYQLHITSTAEHDIMHAVNYIEFTLKNPAAAEHLLDVATEQINSLSDHPQKYHLVHLQVLAKNSLLSNTSLPFTRLMKKNRL